MELIVLFFEPQDETETPEVVLVPDSDDVTEVPNDYTVCVISYTLLFLIFLQPSNSSVLIEAPELIPYGMCIQPVIRTLICVPCGCALTCKTMAKHLHEAHPNTISRIPTGLSEQIAKRYNIVANLPEILGPIPPIDGLPIGQGFVECPHCRKIYGKDGLRAHTSKEHSGMPKIHPKFLRHVHVQQLNRGSHKSYFEVFPTNPPRPTTRNDDLISLIRMHRDSTIESYTPEKLDARVVTPWLLAVQWHEHIQPFSTDQLRELVEMPSNGDPFYGLKEGVLKLFKTAYKIIPETDLLILQRLNTDDPLKGYFIFQSIR